MRAGAFLGAVIAALALAIFAAPAGAGHPQGDKSSTSLMETGFGGESVFRSAVAADPPVDGVGKNMEIVANVPLAPSETIDGPQTVPGGANDADFTNNAADMELAGDYAYVGSYTQGLVIVNISSCDDRTRPQDCKPFVEGVLPCSGGQFDIQLNPEATVAVMAHESSSSLKDCHPNEEGAQIIDISNKSAPKELAFISDRVGANEEETGESSGEVPDGAHNTTLDWPTLYIDQYTNDEPVTDVYDLSTPTAPKRIGGIDFTTNGGSGPHDSYPDHRPDGKDLLYAASIQKSDVIDIADPANPRVLQTIVDPQVGISHGAESNFDRSLLIVTDEYGGGSGVGACGGQQGDSGAVPAAPGQAGNAGLGAVHFYNLDPETGLVAANGTSKAGIFNIEFQPNDPGQIAAEAGCTSHVFWQAPNENRMTIAWYGRGTRIVDFSNPKDPKELGAFIPTGADTWSAKPHRGFIFTGDIIRGMDVLVYTGEEGKAWPTTSGPAEVQRARTQGAAPTSPGAPTNPPSGGDDGSDTDDTSGQRFVISRKLRRTRGRFAPVVVSCRQSTTCRGVVRLRAKFRQPKGRSRGKLRRIRVGSRRFRVGAGETRKLRVRLNRRGRRVVRNRRKVRIIVAARLRPEAFTSSGKVTVRASYPIRKTRAFRRRANRRAAKRRAARRRAERRRG